MSTFDVIVHPTDFSAESDAAFSLATAICRDHFATLVVIHVIPPSSDILSSDWDERSASDVPVSPEWHDKFQRMREIASDVPIRFRLAVGYPVGTILKIAHEEQADLIVIASEQRDHIHLQLHGSVADGLLRQSFIPVCCLRQPPLNFCARANKPFQSASRAASRDREPARST